MRGIISRRPTSVNDSSYNVLMKGQVNSYMYMFFHCPIDITNGNYDNYFPSIAVKNPSTIYLVFYGNSPANPSYYQIRFTKSTDGGNTWSSPIDITNGDYTQVEPAIAIDSSGNIHVVWSGESSLAGYTYYQLRYAKSTDGGITWSNPIDITSGLYQQEYPKIAIDSANNIYVVWDGTSATYTYYQIRYAKSTDGGNTWSSPIDITNTSYNQYKPAIAIDNSDNIHILWRGTSDTYYQIRYIKSTDKGNTWSSPIDITSGNYLQLYPAIVIDKAGNIHVVWDGRSPLSPTYYQIRYAKSIDNGNTWSSPIDITSGNYYQYYPAIATDSFNNIHIVWEGESSLSPNYYQIRYAKSTDGGNTWSNPINISNENYHQELSKIAIDSANNIHILWDGESSQSPNYYQIRYCRKS